MQTQAQVYAAKYAQTIAAQMMRTIRLVRMAATLIAFIGMGVSYSHQAHYLAVIGMSLYAAWSIPGALDSLTFICVKVLSTAAATRSARITAGVVLVFPVSVSCVINFIAPGVLLVKVAFVIAVLLIPAAEIVASRLKPDFRAMHQMELELQTFGTAAAETAPTAKVEADTEVKADDAKAPDLPEAPTSPAPAAPRKYSERHERRLRTGR